VVCQFETRTTFAGSDATSCAKAAPKKPEGALGSCPGIDLSVGGKVQEQSVSLEEMDRTQKALGGLVRPSEEAGFGLCLMLRFNVASLRQHKVAGFLGPG
jgi:hypothetical protein